MTYLALGDSISIDDYTGVEGGGAASQLARRLNADPFLDLTRDGATTASLLERMHGALAMGDVPKIDCATLTIGGNDLLSGYYFREIGQRGAEAVAEETLMRNLTQIGELLAGLGCPVVVNTIYDPTDGDDSRASELGLPPEARGALRRVNGLIRALAGRHRFLFCDLEALFRGHSEGTAEPWLVMNIEPNFAGASAIAEVWHELLRPHLNQAR